MSEQPLRICLLTYRGNPRSGGQGIYVRLLSRELRDLGHHVEVWSGQPYPELFENVELVKVPSLDLWSDGFPFRIPRFRELRDSINREEWGRTMLGTFPEMLTFSNRVDRAFRRANGGLGFDIVHDNQSLGSGLLAVRERMPVVATIHHPITRDMRIALEATRNPYRRFTLRRWYNFLPMQIHVARQMDRVLTISDVSTADIVRDFGLDESRVRMVGNGINLSVFRPIPEIERLEDRLITTLSADVPLKGLNYLLGALHELRRERPHLRLTVIGSPRNGSGTAEEVRRLGLDDIVEFTGRVEAEEIARRYAASTAAVVSSLYEGFGFPAGEAMACEVPLISTRGGALPEVVGEQGHAGVLVQPGSAEELAHGIRLVLGASAEKRASMGKAGRARVLELFTWRRAAERTVEIYRETIAERAHVNGNGRIAQSVARSVDTNGSSAVMAANGVARVATNGAGNAATNGHGVAASNGSAANGNAAGREASPTEANADN
ncbi:MAG: glycosyltransferase family 4 protein [Candidatus Binatia bacterium]